MKSSIYRILRRLIPPKNNKTKPHKNYQYFDLKCRYWSIFIKELDKLNDIISAGY